VDQVGSLSTWPPILNLGMGLDHSITEYYEVAKGIVGYTGTFEYDTEAPSGMQRRILDSTLARELGWAPRTSLEAGMSAVYASYLATKQD
jgi:GDP-L-fucose synthase